LQHFIDWLATWQTLLAGLLAIVAAWITVRGTLRAARLTNQATRDSADREIAAAQEQTRVAQQQIETTLKLERERYDRERFSFLSVLEATMRGVIEDVADARNIAKTAHQDTPTLQGYLARKRVQKVGFDELRDGCLRHGADIIGPLFGLEKAIDRLTVRETVVNGGNLLATPRGLDAELDEIEDRATSLQEQALAWKEGRVVRRMQALASASEPEKS
jgi:hypothetical protein